MTPCQILLAFGFIGAFCIIIVTALDVIRFVREERKKLDKEEKEKKGIEWLRN